MHRLVATRLAAVQETLMALHRGGQGMPSAVTGVERETLVNVYLRNVFPPVFRFGSGVVVDGLQNETGQLDIVIEYPFGLRFAFPNANTGYLYPAESVAAIIEVKSNISSQWAEAVATIGRVRKLQRDLNPSLYKSSHPGDAEAIRYYVPSYIIGYTGFSTTEGLKERLRSTAEDCRPDGVLVVEHGLFESGRTSACGLDSFFLFAAEITDRANQIPIAFPHWKLYADHGLPMPLLPAVEPPPLNAQ